MPSPSWKKLLKTRPTIESINAAMAELGTDGPRGTVVLAATLVESVLRAVLSYHMVTLREEEFDQLFRGFGPLSSFSARIKVAYAFKLIGPKTRDDLDRLRELRNGFAHSQFVLTFDTAEVRAEIINFNCLSGLPGISEMKTRHLFITAIRILMTHLIGKIDPNLPLGPEIRNLG